MNKLLKFTFILFTVLTSNAYTQSINGTPIQDLDIEYIEIKIQVTQINMSDRISVSYDEQGEIYVSNKKPNVNALRDKEGNMIVLPSRIIALNFFAKNGFELVESFASESPSFQYLILRRKQE